MEYTTEPYPAIYRNKLWTHATTRMNLKVIMLSEKRQISKRTHYVTEIKTVAASQE